MISRVLSYINSCDYMLHSVRAQSHFIFSHRLAVCCHGVHSVVDAFAAAEAVPALLDESRLDGVVVDPVHSGLDGNG